MNNGAVNMCVQISLWVPVFRSLGRKSKHEIAQSCGNSFFFFNRNRRAPKLGPRGTCLGRGEVSFALGVPVDSSVSLHPGPSGAGSETWTSQPFLKSPEKG